MLGAFYAAYRLCGDLEASVDELIVWIAWDYGASMAHRMSD
jgi:hypothetical protein